MFHYTKRDIIIMFTFSVRYVDAGYMWLMSKHVRSPLVNIEYYMRICSAIIHQELSINVLFITFIMSVCGFIQIYSGKH